MNKCCESTVWPVRVLVASLIVCAASLWMFKALLMVRGVMAVSSDARLCNVCSTSCHCS